MTFVSMKILLGFIQWIKHYLVSIVENICTVYNLEFQNMLGQAYDGASNVKGHKSGVKTQILAKNERALFFIVMLIH